MDKMQNEDSDFRYMAASDLLEQLKVNGLRAADRESQRRLCKSVIALLTDSSSEVQAMAQKCLPPLSRFVEDSHAVFMVEKLLDHVVTIADPAADCSNNSAGVKSLRDVASLGLKSIIADLPVDSNVPGIAIANHALPRLLKVLSSPNAAKTPDLLVEVLELLDALLNHLSPQLAKDHDKIRATVLPHLASERPFVCKRATNCLATLAPVCSEETFDDIVAAIVLELGAARSREKTRTAVHAIWAISKKAGHRLAKDMPILVPTMFSFCNNPEFEEDDELREYCLQTLESFVDRCTREMAEYAEPLSKLIISLAKYDPNYADDEEGDESMDDTADGGDDEEDEWDDDEFSDDDDSSWRVRRAAVKCIHAAIVSHYRPTQQLYSEFGLLLVSRIKEREEAVKLDVISAFTALLRQTGGLNSSEAQSFLKDATPKIVRAVRKELDTVSAKTMKARLSSLALLRELLAISPATVSPLLGSVIPDVQKSLGDPHVTVKTEALVFLHSIIPACGPEVLQNHAAVLIPRVIEASEDRYYKITAESIRLCAEFVSSFGTASPALKETIAPMVPAIHDVALKRLIQPDQDSEVKEATLNCLGASVALFGSHLGSERLDSVAKILCVRLGNEVTRLPTVLALNQIADSDHASVLAPVMESMTKSVVNFLRKRNNLLRLASLNLLTSSPHFSPENDQALLSNVAGLISEDDLRVAALSLKMCARLVRTRGASICSLVGVHEGVFDRVCSLLVSPMLQGRAVDSILDFMRALGEVNADPLTAATLLASLRAKVVSIAPASSATRGGMNPVRCIAKCVAVICQVTPPEQWSQAASQYVGEVSSAKRQTRTYALACLGELGRLSLLGGEGGDGKLQSQAAILGALDGDEDVVKAAAAVALGGVASGDGASGIPALVELVRQRPEIRYLLLLSLKDAIAFSQQADVSKLTDLLLQVLLEDIPVAISPSQSAGPSPGSSADSPEDAKEQQSRLSGQESVQIATAECLGLLAQVNPTAVLPQLKSKLVCDNTALRSSVISALKFVVSSGPADLEPSAQLKECLSTHIGAFLALVSDSDVTVRKNAVQTINAVARGHPDLLVPHLDALLPDVYAATVKNPELVHMVDLGPFKYEEDFGLDLRKSAFDTMRTLISGVLWALIPLPAFVEHAVEGLGDKPDVRSIAQLVLTTLAALPTAPPTLVFVLPSIVKALEATLNERMKSNPVRQEQERHAESINGALRVIVVLDNLTALSEQAVFKKFMDQTVRTDKLGDKFDKLQEGSSAAPLTSSDIDAMRD